MGVLLGTLMSMAGPAVAGWLLVRRVWPEAPSGLRLSLGIGLGTGLTGTIYFLALTVTNSAVPSLVFSEAVLVGGIVFLARRSRSPLHVHPLEGSAPDRKGFYIFLVASMLAGASFLLLLELNANGQWDALAIWNMKAKFIAMSPDPLTRILDPALEATHTDYPLLLPAMIARGWRYIGNVSNAMPIAVAGLFTACTFFLVVQSLKILTGSQQAYLTGCVLAATPFFLELGAFQYADNIVAFFFTAAIAMYCTHDALGASGWRLPFLGGLASGMMLCTKSEGVLLLLATFGARLLLSARRNWRSSWQEAWGSLLGLSPGLVTFLSFKMWPPVPDPLTAQFTVQTLLLRLPRLDLHWAILKGMTLETAKFGAWLLLPAPFLIAHILIAGKGIGISRGRAPWLTPALAIPSVICGYYFVYLLTPYSLSWHIQTSYSRLLIQMWPSALLLYALVAAPQQQFASRRISPKRIALVAAAIVTGVALMIALLMGLRQWNSPTLSLSKTEVVAGSDSYILKVSQLAGLRVAVRYSIDDGKPEEFVVSLGAKGEVKFDVPADTRKGTYHFLQFRWEESGEWIQVPGAVTLIVK